MYSVRAILAQLGHSKRLDKERLSSIDFVESLSQTDPLEHDLKFEPYENITLASQTETPYEDLNDLVNFDSDFESCLD